MVPRGKHGTVLLCVGIFLFCLPNLSSSSSSTSTQQTLTTSETNDPSSSTTTTVPTSTSSQQPSSTPTTLISTAPATPSSTAPTTPTSTVPTTPSSTVPTTPSATAPTTPSSTAPTTPSSTVPTTPSSTAPTTPSSTVSTTPSSSATTTPSSSATTTPSSTVSTTPSSTATTTPSSSAPMTSSSSTPTTVSSSAAQPSSSSAVPTTTVTTGAPEEYPNTPVNEESYFELKIAFSYKNSSNASTIVAKLNTVFKDTPGFLKVTLNASPNRVRRDTTPTDSFTVSFVADVIQNNTDFDSAIHQNVARLSADLTFDDNINSTIDTFIAEKSDICKAAFVCQTAYECVPGGMCQYRCKKCSGSDVCSLVVNATMVSTKCSPITGPATQAPTAASNDDERLIQVAVPLAVVLFLVILALIYACHKLHRQKYDGNNKSYTMSQF